jgi:PST family polysaccharide transporter
MAVGVWLARYLGPDQFGQLNFALAFVTLFSALANVGIDSVVVRDLVKSPKQASQLLGTALILKLMGAVIAFISATILIASIRYGDRTVFWLVFFASAGFLFQSLDVIDLWFQSEMRLKRVVLARNTAFLIVAVAKIGLILVQAPLIAFAVAGLVEVVLAAAGLFVIYRLEMKSLRTWQFDASIAIGLIRDGWSLMLSGIVVLLYMRIDQVMLGDLADDVAVGTYSAAVKISEVSYFIPTVLVSVIAPVLVRAKENGEELYHRRLIQLFRAVTFLSCCIVLPMYFLAQPIIDLLYGVTYQSAGEILKIHVWALLFVALGVASSQYLIIEGLTQVSLQRTAIGAVVNVVLNVLWIPDYGAIGAAWATLISYGIATFWLIQGPRSFTCMRLMARGLLPVKA